MRRRMSAMWPIERERRSTSSQVKAYRLAERNDRLDRDQRDLHGVAIVAEVEVNRFPFSSLPDRLLMPPARCSSGQREATSENGVRSRGRRMGACPASGGGSANGRKRKVWAHILGRFRGRLARSWRAQTRTRDFPPRRSLAVQSSLEHPASREQRLACRAPCKL